MFQEKLMQRYIFSMKLDLCKVYFITDYNACEMFTQKDSFCYSSAPFTVFFQNRPFSIFIFFTST